MSNFKDQIYSTPQPELAGFSFNDQVATVFDDMIGRSVPLYQEIQQVTAHLCSRLAQPGTCILDLGCASGSTLALLAGQIKTPEVRIIGVDNSQAMLAVCREKLRTLEHPYQIELVTDDIRSFPLDHYPAASIIILNYTLQFIPLANRPAVLSRLVQNLIPGGAIILSEKVTHSGKELGPLLYDLHHDFKRQNGYSDLEIAQKRDALEQVLVPLSTEQNIELLMTAGLAEVEVYAKWYNFVSMVGIRSGAANGK